MWIWGKVRAVDVFCLGLIWDGVDLGAELAGYWIGEVDGGGTEKFRGVEAGWSVEGEGLG
jgi:hypothetical protein